MSAPFDLSADIASQLGAATGLPAFGDAAPFPYAGPLPALYVTRTLDRRVESDYSFTYGNAPGRPNLYTAVLVAARFVPGMGRAAALAARQAALQAIHEYLRSEVGKTLGGLCQHAELPEVRNDPQGNVIKYLDDAFVGAYLTLPVYEAFVTV